MRVLGPFSEAQRWRASCLQSLAEPTNLVVVVVVMEILHRLAIASGTSKSVPLMGTKSGFNRKRFCGRSPACFARLIFRQSPQSTR